MVLRQILSAVGLGLGDLALVEPTNAAESSSRCSLPPPSAGGLWTAADGAGVATQVCGIVAFVTAAIPGGGHPEHVAAPRCPVPSPGERAAAP